MTTKESDRELLTLAAKAIGQQHDDECQIIVFGEGLENNAQRLWDPLMNDGDAFRLAVTLRLVMHVWDDAQNVSVAKTLPDGEDPPADNVGWASAGSSDTGDMLAAARRAIVEVAAAIGKEK